MSKGAREGGKKSKGRRREVKKREGGREGKFAT